MEHILANPNLLPHFRMFMTSTMSLENLVFWQEIERYRSIMVRHACAAPCNPEIWLTAN